MFQKVLVPVDGSKESLEAVKKAYSLLEEGCAKEINILHVGFEPSEAYHYDSVTPMDAEVFKKSGEKIAQRIADQVKEITGSAALNFRVEYGNVVDTICTIAEKDNYDLIVLGHRGLGKVERLMLGSVSNKVANIAPCAVLIIR